MRTYDVGKITPVALFSQLDEQRRRMIGSVAKCMAENAVGKCLHQLRVIACLTVLTIGEQEHSAGWILCSTASEQSNRHF